MTGSTTAGSVSRSTAFLLALLLGTSGCGADRKGARGETENLAQCRSALATAGKVFADYRQAAAADPRQWFKVFSGEIAQRTFLARLSLQWRSEFTLNDKLAANEKLLDGRQIKEGFYLRHLTRPSAGFLLGRRSNFLFGLIMVSPSDPGFSPPDGSFLAPPPKAHISTPWFTQDRYPDYSLSASSVQLDAVVLEGCRQDATVSILHAWRTKEYAALVIGCEASLGGEDLPLFPYEGFRRFAALSDQQVQLPSMTPAGGVTISSVCLDRSFGENGTELQHIGMPSSISATFLPVELSDHARPVLHSLIFQLDERAQWWVPFWAVRKQLAAAHEDTFDLANALKLTYPLAVSPSTDPKGREEMLLAYQTLLNINEEHVSAFAPNPQEAGQPCSTSRTSS